MGNYRGTDDRFSQMGTGYGSNRSDSKAMPPVQYQANDLFKQRSTGINFDKYNAIKIHVKDPMDPDNMHPTKLIDSYGDSGLHPLLVANLGRAMYLTPTPIQRASITYGIQNRDLICCAQTGSGKTAAFLLPVIHNLISSPPPVLKAVIKGKHAFRAAPLVLIMTPTRELAIQIYKETHKFMYDSPLTVGVVFGGQNTMHEQKRRLRDIGADILIATPGRLLDMLTEDYITLANTSHLILDEADRMLDMGFSDQIEGVISGFDMPNPYQNRQTFMFSATFPAKIRDIASRFLHKDTVHITVGSVGISCENITQTVLEVRGDERYEHLVREIACVKKGERVLVFVERKNQGVNSNLA